MEINPNLFYSGAGNVYTTTIDNVNCHNLMKIWILRPSTFGAVPANMATLE